MERLRRGRGGVVAAGDARTAEVGARILGEGGNAVDAAVAAVLAAFVAEPALTGAFGGGFATVSRGERAESWDFFAQRPGRGLAEGAEAGQDFRALEVDFGAATQVFHIGRGSVAVPLLLPGLLALHERHGALPWAALVAPAAELARTGVPLSTQAAEIIHTLSPILRHSPEAEAIFAPDGRLLEAGDLFRAPGLADLLEGLADGTRSPEPHALLEAFAPPAGRFTEADLESADPTCRPSIEVRLGDFEIHLAPPPSAGGLLVGFALRLLEVVPASVWKEEGPTCRHLVSAMAVTAAARAELVDPAFERWEGLDDLAARLLSDAYLDGWWEPMLRAAVDGLPERLRPEREPGSTTHVSVVDAAGLGCGITSSNGEGCGYVVPGTEALANNFLGEEDIHPYGFHRDPPGRHLMSMMAPTSVTRDGRVELVLGSGGSNRIRTALLQVLVHRLLGGRPLHAAVNGPRLHLEGDRLYLEREGAVGRLATSTLEALARLVPRVVVFDRPNFFFGGVHAAARGEAAGDLRRGGSVARA
ncbi:MAG: gamma-glutamyltransferase [Deltaproteobacteria bacterium]|nr:MAG: gamma-glutamyltransferase [Deltaproteobacteria bacterium]